MKRLFFYCGAAIFAMPLLGASLAVAQVDKSVEVTREFTPTIGSATKLSHTPDLSDDIYIKPDIDYSITPIVHHNSVESDTYGAANANFYDFNTQDRFYIKGGFGFPLGAVGDLYTTFGNYSEGHLTAFANFNGMFGKITNDFDEKLSAKQSELSSGLVFSLYKGYKTFDASAVYEQSNWSHYATNSTASDYMSKYRSMRFDVRYGDRFSDLRRWSYRVDGFADIFWSPSNDAVSTMGVSGAVGRKLFSAVDLVLNGGMEYRTSEVYRNTTPYGGINAAYYGRKWSLNVGFDTYFDNVKDVTKYAGTSSYLTAPTSNIYFIPKVNFDINIFSTQIVAYVALNGELEHNDYASLSRINPYVMNNYFKMENTVSRNYSAGIKGSILSEKLVYDASVNYNTIKNNRFWAFTLYAVAGSDNINNYYVANISDLNKLNFSFEMKYMPITKVDLWMNLDINRFHKDPSELYEVGQSAFDMEIGGAYKTDKFRVGMDLEVYSRRKFTQIDPYANPRYSIFEINAAVDLNLFAEWKINRNVAVWAEGNNILGSSLYEWGRYRGYGLNGMFGARVQF